MAWYRVELAGVSQGAGGLYRATLRIEWMGRSYSLSIDRLAGPPQGVKAGLAGDRLVVELVGVGRCEIHVGHLERGCTDCRCLMLPPTR